MQRQIIDEEGIRALVDGFYGKVRGDAVIGPIFNEAIADWGPHLETMYAFWSSITLATGRYKGNPMGAHLKLTAIEPRFFDRWLELFNETVGELFTPAAGNPFREAAQRIACSLKFGLFDYRPPTAPPLDKAV